MRSATAIRRGCCARGTRARMALRASPMSGSALWVSDGMCTPQSPAAEKRLRFPDDDVGVSALDDRLQLRLLGRRHSELVERLPEIVHEGLPLLRRDVEVTL